MAIKDRNKVAIARQTGETVSFSRHIRSTFQGERRLRLHTQGEKDWQTGFGSQTDRLLQV